MSVVLQDPLPHDINESGFPLFLVTNIINGYFKIIIFLISCDDHVWNMRVQSIICFEYIYTSCDVHVTIRNFLYLDQSQSDNLPKYVFVPSSFLFVSLSSLEYSGLRNVSSDSKSVPSG